MARKAAVNRWAGADRDDSVDGVFSSIITAARDQDGSSAAVSTEKDAVVGLYIPSLAMRYLLQNDVFPLSRIYQLTGEEGSCKSALLWEIMRWHMMAGGGAVLAANENKDSPDLRNAIFYWNERYRNRMVVEETYAMEQWQKVFTHFSQRFAAQFDAPGGPGRSIPMCFGVDSITATAPQSEIDEILKVGYATRGFAILANLISRFMKAMPALIKDYPFTMVGTNHLKPATTAQGLPTANVPGGKAVKFMETYELELKKAQNADIEKSSYAGLRLRILCRKNSLGPSRRAIHAEMIWWYQPGPDGKPLQYAIWDWGTADIEFLVGLADVSGKKKLHDVIREITGIHVFSKSHRQAYSTVLGIPKSDPQEYRVLGAALLNRPDLLEQIYPLLGIKQRTVFQPGQAYMDAVAAAREQARQEAEAANPKVEIAQDLAAAAALDDLTPEERDEEATREQAGGAGDE